MLLNFAKVFEGLSAVAGGAYGVWALQYNFNPDAHQAEAMTPNQRYFAELIYQTGIVYLDIVVFGSLGGITGKLLDKLIETINACRSNANQISLRETWRTLNSNCFSFFRAQETEPDNQNLLINSMENENQI